MRWPTPLLRNKPDAHKHDFGHVLVVGGSAPMLGAPTLAALAAMRTGAGLVTCAIPAALNLTLQKKLSPVIMTLPLAQMSYKTLKKHLARFDVVAVGPGMGRGPKIQKFILALIAHCSKPLVIDADALNALAKDLRVLLKNKGVKILTPHAGEMARLTKLSPMKFVKTYHCILVLKGHRTTIASPQGDVYVNRTGNAGMATAGSGDVLTGMIAALVGQGVPPLQAARFGVYAHGRAGDMAAKKKTKAGMIATDIIECIPAALKKP